jgi:hypothetical protein
MAKEVNKRGTLDTSPYSSLDDDVVVVVAAVAAATIVVAL